MTDLVLVVALLAFFGVCVLYVRACERIMGPDEAVDAGPEEQLVSEDGALAAEAISTS